MPATTDLLLPYPDPLEEVDVPADMQALAERLEAVSVWFRFGLAGDRPPAGSVPNGAHWFATDTYVESVKIGGAWVEALIGIPLGVCIPYTGAGDPTGGAWLLADGRLVSITTYPAYDAMIGEAAPVGQKHMYNLGASPGAGQFRIPDKRGRGSIGASNMGTAQGNAAGNSRAQVARGASGGEQTHVVSIAEMPSHVHTFSQTVMTNAIPNAPDGGLSGVNTSNITQTLAAGGGGAHNNLAPYEADNWIVRVR